MRKAILLVSFLSLLFAPGLAGTVVFFEKGFPSLENDPISQAILERALAPLNPRFMSLADLQKKNALAEGDLLVLPSGSAFPADAWETISRHLEHGNFLVLGGRPFFIPVHQDGRNWKIAEPQNTFSRQAGIMHTYSVPLNGKLSLRWDEEAPWFQGTRLSARRVFVNAGFGGRYRGLGFLVDGEGNRIAAPVVAEDLVGRALAPRRRVYLGFDADSAYWGSQDGITLIRRAALYALRGGDRLWVDLQRLSVDPGEPLSGAVDVLRGEESARLTIEVLSGPRVLASRTAPCGSKVHEEIGLAPDLSDPGLYRVRATLTVGDVIADRYTTGLFVRDPALLASGEHLTTGRDYFRLGEQPYLMVGANYFSTDPYTSGLFVGGSLGGNAWVWDRDFAEMARAGLTVVRTGIWLNRLRYLDDVSGAPDERMLRALEAYLAAAARHHMQVIFTFFAFNPQSEMEKGPGQGADRLGPGTNPYLDREAVEAEVAYVRAIVLRFRDVPFLSYDLINEPSFSNPKRLWKGNSPNGDRAELEAWRRWLEKRYVTVAKLAEAWRVLPSEFGGFEWVPLPDYADLEPSRSGNARIVRAVDYNLFAQESFRQWVDTIILAIRNAGSNQAVTVGQDEGGVADRVLNLFWAESNVDYTVNHSWWRDDALLWSSVAAKSPHKPNIIGETGPQPVWSMDGSWRWDELQGLPLVERKFALGFAAANAGVLHWDWTRGDVYGLLRRDGSQKEWLDVLKGIARFAHDAEKYATEGPLPDIALVLPQSLQLSSFGNWGIAVQQNAVRALFHHARATAFAVGEYQLSRLPDTRLIIVPAPWVLHQQAWDLLMTRVQAGATLLVSGRIDADEHWLPVPQRTRGWGVECGPAALTSREAEVVWPEGSARLTFSGERTTYAERGALQGGLSYYEFTLGKGKILYIAYPLELADQLNEVGRIYRYAMKRAGVSPLYETSCEDPGVLICPTRLEAATLYVLTSESAGERPFLFRDVLSGKEFQINLQPGRAALMLVGRDGRILASYNAPH